MKEVISVDREDYRKIVKQLQFQWTKHVLVQTGMNLSSYFPDDDNPESMTIEQKAQLRQTLRQNDILVLDDQDGGIKIYLDKTIIAEWKKPRFDLHQDLSQIDPKKKLYININIDYWSVFDGQELKENDIKQNNADEFVEDDNNS